MAVSYMDFTSPNVQYFYDLKNNRCPKPPLVQQDTYEPQVQQHPLVSYPVYG
ncbi:hypothetical protein [Paenibacillus qinlingensis]|uniref:Uncharacterized protein n=1 Tax=Paenibacillus qinlingensis TaxID=1837343 RepID=A0ABU1NS17_9BACL|nr:hypothetical protein [Paenibacillus qinlingensis]MDR6550271.1 hypothetical protein [Paenibacillus qinlingensis]